MNNENKKLSRKRKRRYDRKIKMDDKMKLLLNKFKTEQKKKKFDKIKILEIEIITTNYSNKPHK